MIDNFVKVTGTSFVRDVNSMGLSNNDTAAKEEYLSKVNMITRQKEEINKVHKELNSLKSDISSIKNMLSQLVSKTDSAPN